MLEKYGNDCFVDPLKDKKPGAMLDKLCSEATAVYNPRKKF